MGFILTKKGDEKMTYIINWIKFKIQKLFGIHELLERVELLEDEIVRLNIRVYSTEDGVDSNSSNINKLFTATSELSRATDQLDNMYRLRRKENQWENEEIDFIQKSYE